MRRVCGYRFTLIDAVDNIDQMSNFGFMFQNDGAYIRHPKTYFGSGDCDFKVNISRLHFVAVPLALLRLKLKQTLTESINLCN